MTQRAAPTRRLATALPLGARTGYAVYGCNLALRAAERGISLLPLGTCDWDELSPRQRAALTETKKNQESFVREFQSSVQAGGANQFFFDGDLLIYLSNQFFGPNLPFRLGGKRMFASVFLENPQLSEAAVKLGKHMEKIFAGSEWNGAVLRRAGLSNVVVAPQGIDPDLFYPGPASGKFKDRFVVFSGGKMEYRKGQDLVVAAMRQFSRQHPETLLLFAWDNAQKNFMEEMDRAGAVRDFPAEENGRTDFAAWLQKNGVEHCVDLGSPLNWQMPPLLREADVAIFPNRCEGGTNLVAMETMACGVPTLLSANTGHLDILSDQTCYPLTEQGPVKPTPLWSSVDEWGESSVEEIVENLNRVFADRAQARRRGLAAAEAMRKMSWANQIDLILREMETTGNTP